VPWKSGGPLDQDAALTLVLRAISSLLWQVRAPRLSPLEPPKSGPPPIAVVTPYEPALTETFIQKHIELLPTRVVHIQGWRPSVAGRTVLPFSTRVYHKLRRMTTGSGLEAETTAAYRKVIRSHLVRAVLAEYGEMGASAADACRLEGVPLIVHFHGFDASHSDTIAQASQGYSRMFLQAAAIVAVSRQMMASLETLGAPAAKLRLNPYGTDCLKFRGADPAGSGMVFLAVGRFIEKKGSLLTLQAFAEVQQQERSARLLMIGDGALLPQCQDFVAQHGLADNVEFLGPRPPTEVSAAMRSVRAFVQHSITASSGDSEGTPVAIIEAGASGLPVVSTRHAGIPDVVVEGASGFLVNEGDTAAMAARMLELARNPTLAGTMGRCAREHVLAHFSDERSLQGLWNIILDCVDGSQDARSGRPHEPQRPLHGFGNPDAGRDEQRPERASLPGHNLNC
jgi:colanic acid/amylovoran biosynthesis glycosyltransferase